MDKNYLIFKTETAKEKTFKQMYKDIKKFAENTPYYIK